MAGNIQALLHAMVDANSAVLHFNFGRKPLAGGAATLLVTDATTAPFSNTAFAVISQIAAYAESIGLVDDLIYIKIWATTSSSTPTAISLGTGSDNRTNFNMPLVCLYEGPLATGP